MLPCFISAKSETQAPEPGFAASYAVQKYYKMLIWQDKEEFYSDKINKNKSSLFNVAIRNAFSTKQTAERNCRKAASFRLNHSSFPALFTPNTQSHSSRPAYPLSRPMSHPYFSMGGTWDGGTVGDLCFIFRFKALSHNRNISWDRDTEETSQGQIVESGVDRVFS